MEKSNRKNGEKTEAKSQRDSRGRFVSGNSGGTGRPRTPKEIKEALHKMTPAALKTYQEVLDDPDVPWKDKIRVAQDILDRVLGKPPQSVNLDEVDKTIAITIKGGEEFAD